MSGFERERMKALPPSRRPCVHYLKKRISFRICTNEYRCDNCEFDQYFYDEHTVHAVVKPVDLMEVEGFRIPQGYYLHHGHTWVRIEEGSSVRVGIDDFALRLLGPLDCVEAPLLGKAVSAGEPHVSLRRGMKQARMLSPVSGVITAVNPKLRESGTMTGLSPYSDCWVMAVHAEDVRKDLKSLMLGQESEEFLKREVDRLHQLIEEVGGPSATDGGHLGYDLYGTMPLLGWERLTRAFLRTSLSEVRDTRL